MICPNCGEQVNEGAMFCKSCGYNLTGYAAPQQEDYTAQATNGYVYTDETAQTANGYAYVNEAPAGDGGSSKDDKNKKLGMIVIGVAAVVVILLIALCVNAFSSSVKDPIDNVVSLVNKKSTNVEKWIKKILPNDIGTNAVTIWNAMVSSDEIDEDEIEEYFEDVYDELEDTYGKNFKVSYKILDKEKLDSDERKDLQDSWRDLADYLDYDDDDWDDMQDELADEIGKSKAKSAVKALQSIYKSLDKFKITEAYEVELKITIEGKEDEDTTKATVYVIKYDGNYCIDWVNSSFGSYSLNSLLWYIM